MVLFNTYAIQKLEVKIDLDVNENLNPIDYFSV